ncbi:MAG TPA: PilZ domain-containing protein, partial [Thermoanaerobaculaceae bacterium]|nr:PilZ domain-containing protein [Thermoanaerobaculaceae bacterium]
QHPLSARVKAFLPARIVDLSSRGVQLELATSLRPQVPCDLRIQLDQGEVIVRGVVRRCRAWGFGLDERDQRVLLYRAGLEFEDAAPDALVKVVSSALEKAAPREIPAEVAPSPEEEPAPTAESAARTPHAAGRVKIRISAENVRKVLGGVKDDD